MNWEMEYKKETGKDAYRTEESRDNCNCFDTIVTQDYVDWLEEKLTNIVDAAP